MRPVDDATKFPIPSHPIVDFGLFRRAGSDLPSLLALPHRILTHSGRSALLLALQLSGVGHGDHVLAPTYHCPTMIAPIEKLGAKPLFYPIDPQGNPDLAYLAKFDSGSARAMIAAHLFGLPRPMRGLVDYCRAYGIKLIEDCAHCFFGSADGAPVGSHGDFAIGSLPKFFPVLQGGVLAWSDGATAPRLAQRQPFRSELRAAWDMADLAARAGRFGIAGAAIRRAAAWRRSMRGFHAAHATASIPVVAPQEIRTRGLEDPLLAPTPLRQIDGWIVEHTNAAAVCRRRRSNFQRLSRLLGGLATAKPLYAECRADSAPYVLPLLLRDPDKAYARMRALKLPVFRWDLVWPGTPAIDGDAAIEWARGVVQLCCHQSLTDSDIENIVRGIRTCDRP